MSLPPSVPPGRSNLPKRSADFSRQFGVSFHTRSSAMKLSRILIASASVAGLFSQSVYAVNDLGTAANPTTPTAPSATGNKVQTTLAKAHKVKTSTRTPARKTTHRVAHHAKKPMQKSSNL